MAEIVSIWATQWTIATLPQDAFSPENDAFLEYYLLPGDDSNSESNFESELQEHPAYNAAYIESTEEDGSDPEDDAFLEYYPQDGEEDDAYLESLPQDSGFSCSWRALGTDPAAAPTWIQSYGAFSRYPCLPSPVTNRTLSSFKSSGLPFLKFSTESLVSFSMCSMPTAQPVGPTMCAKQAVR